MRLVFTENAWDDYLYWQQHDARKLARINELLRDLAREPYKGIGKPEPLRGNLSGWWSRRIDTEHRLVYRVEQDQVIVLQCRYHY
ncbi:MAG TPA: Txe/YoeB family addiction module toxin [Saprospiraceae bacterium]|nr:Txe/YoeB family addiction module toxin [Saprospiraceae bacterium]